MSPRLPLLLLLVAGCGQKIVYVTADQSRPRPIADLSQSIDLAQSMDLSLPREEDMHISLPPEDLFRACSMPLPGAYRETNGITYIPSNNPMFFTTTNNLTVVVRNDGSFERPIDNVLPDFIHCDTPPIIDQTTCLAPCCGGNSASTPSVYYFAGGWRLFKVGTCFFTDPNNSNVRYSAQFTSISGAP